MTGDVRIDRARKRRNVAWLAGLTLAVAATVALVRREPVERAASPAVPSSIAVAPASAELRAAGTTPRPAPPTAFAEHLTPETGARIHAEFERAHPRLEGKVAVSGRVVGPDGAAAGEGRIDYRMPGAAWKSVRIEYDGTFEINDPGAGPFEFVASLGSAPPNRHSAPATAGRGSRDVLLRAAGDGRLRFHLSIGVLERKPRAFLTREDEDTLGVESSGHVDIDADGEGEFTGLEAGATYILFVRDDWEHRYAYRAGVRASTERLEVTKCETMPLDVAIETPGCMNAEWGYLRGRGVEIRLQVPGFAHADGSSIPDDTIDVAFVSAPHRRVYPRIEVPRLPLHVSVAATRCDRDDLGSYAVEADLVPGEPLVTAWKEVP